MWVNTRRSFMAGQFYRRLRIQALVKLEEDGQKYISQSRHGPSESPFQLILRPLKLLPKGRVVTQRRTAAKAHTSWHAPPMITLTFCSKVKANVKKIGTNRHCPSTVRPLPTNRS